MSASVLLQRLTETAPGLLRGGYLLVRDGEGFQDLPQTVVLKTGASARVVRVDSELGLRHALWKNHPAPVIALIPDTLSLPADLREGAERRRVHTLSGDEVLSALLGTKVLGVDDLGLRTLAVEHAAQIQARLRDKTTPTVVDRALLERTLVEVVADLHDLRAADGQLAALLARWIPSPPRWEPVVRQLAASTLETQHGDAGRVVAWTLEAPEERPRELLIYGALLGVEGEVPPSAWGPLVDLRERTDLLRAPNAARAHVVRLASEVAARLGHGARPLLDEADTLARKLLPTHQLQTSPLLPLAFEERAHGMAIRLAQAEPVGREDFRALRRHALAVTAERQLHLLDDMARLGRYLRQARPAQTDAAALAVDYLRDHAHADRCVRRVERALASVPAHHAEARALLSRVAAYRDTLNRAYAEALSEQYPKTLYSEGVTALQNLVRDVLCARQPGPGSDKVFLLVMDGCSVPVFLDLLEQLVHRDHRIGLELDRSNAMAVRLGAGIAPLPTITSHARGALFLGAVPKDPFAAETLWREDGERVTDPARFNQNQALKDTPRKLFLKGDLADGGQALQETLRGEIPVVAAVFNAVDDRISSHDTGAVWRLEVDDITGLLPALQAALDAGRRVLLTADHGHTPFRGKELRVGAGSTPRYARLQAGESVPEGFIEIDCGELAGESGRMAFAWRSGAYRGQVQVGFHGGCSLEEMVVPVAWLGRDGVAADPPSWWHEVGTPELTPAPAPRRTVAPQPPPRAPTPPAVFGQDAPALPLTSAQPPVERLPVPIRLALDAQAQRAVAWILRDGPIRTSVLAHRVGRPDARVQGWLTKLNRTLAEHGARLESEKVDRGELQWRYVGPVEDP